MNKYTVGKATFGLANYLKSKYSGEIKIALAYDSRNNSRYFAEVSAGIFANCGFKVYLYDTLVPVPVLSFTTAYLGCTAGVMITASHNPKEYNGYKVYDNRGCQFCTEDAKNANDNYKGSGDVALIAHSHLDIAYYWRRIHAVQKNLRTVLIQLRLMDKYPDFKYTHTQPYVYETLEKYYPDVFGNSWILPQILKKSGVDYFVSNKMSTWNDTNRFPHNNFIWRGIDGTDVLACVPPTHFITWNMPSQIQENWEAYIDKDCGGQTMNMFGYGDGGSGCTKEMLEMMIRNENITAE